MPLESPTVPQTLWPYISHLAAIILAAVCTLFVSRKKDAAAIRRSDAEIAHIELADELSAIESVRSAAREVAATTMRAQRLLQERNHWEVKAEGYYLELDALKLDHAQQTTILQMAQYDIKKMKSLLDLKGISYSEADKM